MKQSRQTRLSCFTLLCFADVVFSQTGGHGGLCPASVLVPFFQQHFLTACLASQFGHSHIVSSFFLIVACVLVTCD